MCPSQTWLPTADGEKFGCIPHVHALVLSAGVLVLFPVCLVCVSESEQDKLLCFAAAASQGMAVTGACRVNCRCFLLLNYLLLGLPSVLRGGILFGF